METIAGSRRTFGGILALLCGDFRQILPIIEAGPFIHIIHDFLKTFVWLQRINDVETYR